jgi:polyhydroxybutyrate depolymerase
MKKILSIVLLLSLSVSFIPVEAAETFRDTGDYKYREAIDALRDKGIVSGYQDGDFRPHDPINRAEMLKIILSARLGGESAVGSETGCFQDVGSEWFAPYVCYAKAENIVKGYAGNRFNPGQSVNMVEGLKMALETFDQDVSASGEGVEWFQPYIEFAHSNNVFSKYSYVPGRSMTRGEMAFLIHALLLNDEGFKTFTGVRQNLSLGCGKPAPKTAPTSSVINGGKQTYITDVPSSYDSNTPIALTFGWHGRTNPNTQVRGYYKVYEASKGGTIMVYPAGVGPWNIDRDLIIFDQLLAEFSENYCIDLDKIYIVGHSLGSWFTNSLACARGDVIRASGSLGGSTTDTGCTGPVAAITMHNPKDELSPFRDGVKARDLHLAQNACGAPTMSYASPDKANCVLYTQCAPDQPVVWCPHTEDYSWGDYYTHGWPKWTGSEIWKFFENLD